MSGSGSPHLHSKFVHGCFRCEISRDEAWAALLDEVEASRAKLAQPCGSCHPCTEWANQTWINAGERLPSVQQWHDVHDELESSRVKLAEIRAVLDGPGDSGPLQVRFARRCQEVRAILNGPTP